MIGSTEILMLLIAILGSAYVWVKYKFSYWKRQKVAYLEPHPIFGNLKEMCLMQKSPADHLKDLYNDKTVENEPVVGIHVFHTPSLLIRDPELIKMILVKDFNKFSDRYSSADPHTDSLGSNNLFFVKNPLWKQIRAKLTPVFTSGKMKQMFSLVDEIGGELDSYLLSLPVDPKTNSTCKELKEVCALYSTDVIASVAYGLQANSLKNPNAEFRRNGRKIFDFTYWRAFEFTILFFLPKLVKLFKCKLFSEESSTFLRSSINYVMTEREKSGIPRNDLIDILVSFKNETQNLENKSDLKIDGDVLVAQAAVFFTAGFETSSSAMSFGLYELSKQPEIQDRLRNEIKDVLTKNNGKLTYDAIHNMEYLNMVLQEVLRLYPPLPFLDRQCTLSGSEKDYSLEPFSEFKIPNGMPVYIPFYALQRDPKYFSDPDTFDPERFSPENKANIVPYTYMPFGIGPHNCIGERFGLMQTKIGFINFLKNHKVRLSEKSHKTMVLNKKALIIQSEGGIYCDIVRDPLFK